MKVSLYIFFKNYKTLILLIVIQIIEKYFLLIFRKEKKQVIGTILVKANFNLNFLILKNQTR